MLHNQYFIGLYSCWLLLGLIQRPYHSAGPRARVAPLRSTLSAVWFSVIGHYLPSIPRRIMFLKGRLQLQCEAHASPKSLFLLPRHIMRFHHQFQRSTSRAKLWFRSYRSSSSNIETYLPIPQLLTNVFLHWTIFHQCSIIPNHSNYNKLCVPYNYDLDFWQPCIFSPGFLLLNPLIE